MAEAVPAPGGVVSEAERQKLTLYLEVLDGWPDMDFGAMKMARDSPFNECNPEYEVTTGQWRPGITFLDRATHCLAFESNLEPAKVPLAIRSKLSELLGMPRQEPLK